MRVKSDGQLRYEDRKICYHAEVNVERFHEPDAGQACVRACAMKSSADARPLPLDWPYFAVALPFNEAISSGLYSSGSFTTHYQQSARHASGAWTGQCRTRRFAGALLDRADQTQIYRLQKADGQAFENDDSTCVA